MLELEFFTKRQTEELIQKYLEFARLATMPNKTFVSECHNASYPFTDDAIGEIHILAQANSSKIIKLCRICIDHLIQTKSKTVTLELVKKLHQA